MKKQILLLFIAENTNTWECEDIPEIILIFIGRLMSDNPGSPTIKFLYSGNNYLLTLIKSLTKYATLREIAESVNVQGRAVCRLVGKFMLKKEKN